MKWLNDVSPASFGDKGEALYNAYKDAYRVAKAAREAFEAEARASLETEHGVDPDTIAFNYRFGKLSVGIGEARERKAAKPVQSLTDWLAKQS